MSSKANEQLMVGHLEYMFGGLEHHELYSEGLVELGTLDQVRFFPLDKLEKAARYAARRTAEGSKVYVHCGLIKPTSAKVIAQQERRSTGHVGGGDVMCWPVVWGEADHKHLVHDRSLIGEQRNAARLAAFSKVARDHGLEWGWTSATGTIPSLRVQGFMRLAEPAAPTDPNFWQVVKSLSRNGNLDAGANNSSQVLRLCGSVSFASGKVKADEAGEAPRINEPVTCLVRREGRVDIANAHATLNCLGLLSTAADAPTTRASAKDVNALRAMVKPPENAPTFETERVRDAVVHIVAQAATAEAGRRDAVLRAAKTIGGLLWTGAFEVEEILAEDDGLDDGQVLSLTEAYQLRRRREISASS